MGLGKAVLNWFDSKQVEYEFKYVHWRYDHVISHVTNIVSNIQKLEHGILNICSQQPKIATSITDKKLQKLNVTLMNNGNMLHCYCKISVSTNFGVFKVELRGKISLSAEFDCMTVKNLQLELSLRVHEKYCGRKFQYFEFCGFLYLNCIPVYCNRKSLSFDNIIAISWRHKF